MRRDLSLWLSLCLSDLSRCLRSASLLPSLGWTIGGSGDLERFLRDRSRSSLPIRAFLPSFLSCASKGRLQCKPARVREQDQEVAMNSTNCTHRFGKKYFSGLNDLACKSSLKKRSYLGLAARSSALSLGLPSLLSLCLLGCRSRSYKRKVGKYVEYAIWVTRLRSATQLWQ